MRNRRIKPNRFFGKVMFILLFTVALLSGQIGQTIAAEKEEVPMDTVDEKAKIMYELALNGQFEEAKRIHEWLVNHFPSVTFDQYNLNTHQLAELFRSFDRVGEAVTKTDMDEQDRVQYIFAFRLAVDASISKAHPLWKKSGEHLLVKLEDMEQKLNKGSKQEARRTFQEWQRQFEIIRPAIYTGKKEEEYLPLISYIRYLDNNDWMKKDGQQNIIKLKEMFQELLGNNKKTAVDPALWSLIVSIGSFLFVSLSYAGWKKYKGEKQRHHMRD